MSEIPLTNGGVALVDDEDYARVMLYRWGKYFFARHQTYYVKQTKPYVTGQRPYLHRFLLGIERFGPRIEHRNGNGLDNRKENLREVTHWQRLSKMSETGVRNVYWEVERQKYRVQIWVLGKAVILGRFTTLEDAEAAVIQARFQMMTPSDGR